MSYLIACKLRLVRAEQSAKAGWADRFNEAMRRKTKVAK